MKAFYRFLFVM